MARPRVAIALVAALLPAGAGGAEKMKPQASWTIRYEMQAKVTQYWKYDLAVETLEKE